MNPEPYCMLFNGTGKLLISYKYREVPMRFLFLTMEATNNSALKHAAAVVNREFDCRLEVMIFNLGLQGRRSLAEA